MPCRILLIEDNPDITNIVQDELEQVGYHALTASDGITGLIQAREHQPDLIILDLGLPDFDGSEVARRLRKTSPVPIIVLTAMDSVDRKVHLLNLGANDYVTKPFHMEELLARIKIQLRQNVSAQVLQIGDLEIHPHKRLSRYAGQDVRLSRKEFDLLIFLTQQPGRVYSRQEIEQELWDGEFPTGSNVVDVHMANLRSKFRKVG